MNSRPRIQFSLNLIDMRYTQKKLTKFDNALSIADRQVMAEKNTGILDKVFRFLGFFLEFSGF